MEREFSVGEVVFFMGKVSPWFWHKGVVGKVDEEKGVKIGKKWYEEGAVTKYSPQMASHLALQNIEKQIMMLEGKVQYEGETLDSYLTRNRKKPGEE